MLLIKNSVIGAPNTVDFKEDNFNLTESSLTEINSNEIKVREKRFAIPLIALAVGNWLFNVAAATTAMTAFSTGVVAFNHHVRENVQKEILIEDEEKTRIKLGCEENNFGCMQNTCWSNCGPRIKSGDWCLTVADNKTIEKGGNQITLKYRDNTTVSPTSCNYDSDCDPCWSCVGACLLEN